MHRWVRTFGHDRLTGLTGLTGSLDHWADRTRVSRRSGPRQAPRVLSRVIGSYDQQMPTGHGRRNDRIPDTGSRHARSHLCSLSSVVGLSLGLCGHRTPSARADTAAPPTFLTACLGARCRRSGATGASGSRPVRGVESGLFNRGSGRSGPLETAFVTGWSDDYVWGCCYCWTCGIRNLSLCGSFTRSRTYTLRVQVRDRVSFRRSLVRLGSVFKPVSLLSGPAVVPSLGPG